MQPTDELRSWVPAWIAKILTAYVQVTKYNQNKPYSPTLVFWASGSSSFGLMDYNCTEKQLFHKLHCSLVTTIERSNTSTYSAAAAISAYQTAPASRRDHLDHLKQHETSTSHICNLHFYTGLLRAALHKIRLDSILGITCNCVRRRFRKVKNAVDPLVIHENVQSNIIFTPHQLVGC